MRNKNILIVVCLLFNLTACNLIAIAPTPTSSPSDGTTVAANSGSSDSMCMAENLTTGLLPIYNKPDGTTIAQLQPNESLFVVSKPKGWFVVYLRTSPVIGWIPETGITTKGNCQPLDEGQIIAPPSVCSAVNKTDQPQGIYAQPDSASVFIGRMPPDETFNVLAEQGEWAAIFVPALTSIGWVDQQYLQFVGACK